MTAPERGEDAGPPAPDLGSILTSRQFGRAPDDTVDAADRELDARPPFSIRARLLLAFGFFFLLCLATVIWSIDFLARIHDKVLFLEVANQHTAEIQQARRGEKNYLLYGTRPSLDEAREHARSALDLVTENLGRFDSVIGASASRRVVSHLQDYVGLLDELERARDEREKSEIEKKLRVHGGEMVSLAIEVMSRERALVDRMLSLTRSVPWFFLATLFVLMLFVLNFVARQIVGTLSRFMEYTERIGHGDFTPITPTRKYRDEFSNLAHTLNRMMREIDQQQRILVESHKMRAMGNLVAGVAHELNNPLNNILLTACVLRDEKDSVTEEDRDEMLDDLVGQSERAKGIVRNLLDYARKSETRLQALDLSRIVDDTLRLVGNQVRVKRVRLVREVPDELPPVHGDRQLLGQVFMNLILNALDVLPERGEIRIRADADRKDGYLAVDVTDDGPGIPKHVLDRIFDPFFTTKKKGRGTGLGLSVSRGIVEKLGGDLLVSSTPGSGTTFSVLLPVTTIPSEVSSADGEPGGPAGDMEVSS